jgi:hypothetical protein
LVAGAAGFAAGVAEEDAEEDAAGLAVFLWRFTLDFAGVWLCAGAAAAGLAGVAGVVPVDCANRATEASMELKTEPKINFFILLLLFLLWDAFRIILTNPSCGGTGSVTIPYPGHAS